MTPAARLADSTVAIVGLGLMGGSLGLALAGHCARRTGWDAAERATADARSADAVDDSGALDTIVATADIVVLAAPVSAILELAPRVAAAMRPGALLTDLGSTKRDIAAAFDGLPTDISAVGSHPMCGGTGSGVLAASATLFTGATWAVTPGERSVDESALAVFDELIRATGASPLRCTPEQHDAAVARVSHLPYATSQALIGMLDALPHDLPAAQLAATGFQGATRMAGGDVDMWHAILTSNRDEIRAAIGEQISQLAQLDQLLDDPVALRERLTRGHAVRAQLTGG